MGADTAIEWATHTFNPWTGCQKVSPACDHCYAEAQAKRNTSTFGGWGPGAERKRTSESYWRQPLLWNKRAAKDGTRPRVFCASMADVFDNAVPEDWRHDLWQLVRSTPSLDWLMLTKRPQNIRRMLPADWRDGDGYPQVWLGTTVENQAEADRRIRYLRAVPAAKRFLSCEPLLGPVDLTRARSPCGGWDNYLTGDRHRGQAIWSESRGLDWIIAGGESGPKARPSHPDWFRSLRDQCQAAGVPFFFKQNGEWLSRSNGAQATAGTRWGALDRAGTLYEGTTTWNGRNEDSPDGEAAMVRVGKKAAGALLNGREWREVPA